MGEFANSRLTRLAASGGAVAVLTLNLFLILQTFGISIPGWSGG
jgi:manganese transport protein